MKRNRMYSSKAFCSSTVTICVVIRTGVSHTFRIAMHGRRLTETLKIRSSW
jgi:hypothetical protein